jgi:hypothetical protein
MEHYWSDNGQGSSEMLDVKSILLPIFRGFLLCSQMCHMNRFIEK